MAKQDSVECFLVAESLAPGNGGICRLARLVMRVLGDWVSQNGGAARGVVLSDEHPPADAPFPIMACGGSRLKFIVATHTAALNHDRFVYDFLGMARAHCRIPVLRRPFMAYIHGIEIWEQARPDRLAWAGRADMLVSNTQYTRDRADTLHGGFARAKVCWLATENDLPPAQSAPVVHPPRVLILSRISHEENYKGHRELIEAWPEVTAAVPDAVLTIAGKGDATGDYQKLAADSPAGNKVEFLGFVPEEEMDGLWAQTDVFAMPSRGEGFGLVYIEAMRHGIPVIASVHDAGQEVNVDGVTGYNVNLDHPGELACRIIGLLKDSDARRRMGAAGYDRWQNHFRYAKFRDRFFDVLDEFC